MSDLERLQVHERYDGKDQVQVANGAGLSISHIGHSHLAGSSLKLNNILHVPYISKHLLFPLPCEVYKLCVSADSYHLSPDLLKPLILLCQSSKLSSSDKGEVRRIEEKDSPFFISLY